jgi:prepilin-type N-terminal cleavage/methylation domain-containing protein
VPRASHRAVSSSGFTLVELLVVIGIIAVLIAILLPALSGAREHANRVKCLATLRTMGQAAQVHAQEHRGHMPLAGMFPTAIYPDYLGDPARTKYTYFKDGSRDDGGPALAPAPLSASLGQYMGLPAVLGTRQELQDSLRGEDAEAGRDHFERDVFAATPARSCSMMFRTTSAASSSRGAVRADWRGRCSTRFR